MGLLLATVAASAATGCATGLVEALDFRLVVEFVVVPLSLAAGVFLCFDFASFVGFVLFESGGCGSAAGYLLKNNMYLVICHVRTIIPLCSVYH